MLSTKEKPNKKRRLAPIAWFKSLPKYIKISLTLIAVTLTAGVALFWDRYVSYHQTLNSLKIEFTKQTIREYSKTKLDTKKQLITKVDGEIVEITPKELDLQKLGKFEVKATIQKLDKYAQKVQKTETIIIEVKDTKTPVIELKSDKVEIIKGADIDLKENVASAKDPVDGDVNVEVKGNVNKDQLGEYDVKVIAKDKNNNETSKDYKVIVNEAPKADEPVTQVVENGRTVYKTQSGKTYTNVPKSTPVVTSPSAPVVRGGQTTAPAPTPIRNNPVANTPAPAPAPSVVCNPNGLMVAINSYRARMGKGTLAYSPALASGAQAYSATSAPARGIHAYGDFDENISLSNGDVSATLSKQASSPAHNANMLMDDHSFIGVGCSVQNIGRGPVAVYVIRFN